MKIDYLVNKNGNRIDLNKFTVLVGPNNAGKSRTLRDIHEHFVKGGNAKPVIIESLGTTKPQRFDEALNDLELKDHPNAVGQKIIRAIGPKLTNIEEVSFRVESFERQYIQSDDYSFIFGNIAKFRITHLDAESRLSVAKKSSSHNPHESPPQNILQALFGKGEIESELQEAFVTSFDTEIKLDYSGMTQLALRIADEFEEIPQDPREAFPIISKYQILDDQGDGYKSFAGVILSLLLSKNRVVLLDEPEAFLHPAQARQLGYWIAEHSTDIEGQIIVATHNSNFLSGILASSQDVDIYRLNRDSENTVFNLMPAEATENLAKSPLLSSQRILDAIFHTGVVVCEADADRAVYQTAATKEFGNNDLIFIHAHNKQTIPRVVKLFKDVSIPVCAIADLDLINSPSLIELAELCTEEEDLVSELKEFQTKVREEIEGAENQEILNKLKNEIEEFLEQLKKDEHELSGARGALNRLRKDSSDWKIMKVEGIKAFSDELNEEAEQIITKLKIIGIYLPHVGELEGWMDLGTRQKNKWIVKALEEIYDGNCSEELKDFVGEVIGFFEK
ncbi:MAG: AAA family ATPase [Balneolaceae bacterium]|nr:AAA family ATPase [Balneolaceae bacterium]